MDLSHALCSFQEMQWMAPYGKLSLSLLPSDNLLVLSNAKQEFKIPLSAIKYIVILDQLFKDGKER
jgi:hypothetical protein